MNKPQPLFFLPGAMCDQRLWLQVESFIHKLAPDKFDCHFLNVPETANFEEALLTLKRQFNELTTEAVKLVAFSLGGYLSASLVKRFPGLIQRLMLVSSMPCALSSLAIKRQQRIMAFVEQQGYQGISYERAQELVDEAHMDNRALLRLISDMDSKAGGERLLKQLALIIQREDTLPFLHQAQIPVRLSVGESDIKVDLTSLSPLVEQYELMDLIVTPHTGHMFPLESPQILAQQIIDWF